MEWDVLMQWWPYRPLYRGGGIGHARIETFYVSSQTGGRGGNPRKEISAANVVYAPEGVDPQSLSFNELIDAGAVEVKASSYPKESGGRPVLTDDGPLARWTKPVVVRGYPGRIVTLRRPQANVDQILVLWEVVAKDGTTIQWKVAANPRVYDESAVLSLIEEMQSFE